MADEKNDKLAKPMGSLFAGKKVGVAAKIANAKSAMNPEESTNRIGIVFDDSGSMRGEPLQKAKEAFTEFVRVCNPADTAIALYLLGRDNANKKLTNDLFMLDMYVQGLDCPSGTPLFTSMDKLINNEKITRAIVFSDGSPTDGKAPLPDETTESFYGDNTAKAKAVVAQYKEKGIVADTVFIGSTTDTTGIYTMKWIAEQTGGIFMHFTEPGLFAKNFKYLSPAYRYLLMDKNFREEISKK